jgi:hypothetical protein
VHGSFHLHAGQVQQGDMTSACSDMRIHSPKVCKYSVYWALWQSALAAQIVAAQQEVFASHGDTNRSCDHDLELHGVDQEATPGPPPLLLSFLLSACRPCMAPLSMWTAGRTVAGLHTSRT